MCFFLVSLILQDFFDRLFLGRLFAFLCARCGFPYPVADVPQLLQILLHLCQRYFQLCDFAEKFFLLLLQLLLGAVLIVRVLGKVGVYIFLIEGEIVVDGEVLKRRDGMGVYDTNSVELETLKDSQILLIEVPM